MTHKEEFVNSLLDFIHDNGISFSKSVDKDQFTQRVSHAKSLQQAFAAIFELPQCNLAIALNAVYLWSTMSYHPNDITAGYDRAPPNVNSMFELFSQTYDNDHKDYISYNSMPEDEDSPSMH